MIDFTFYPIEWGCLSIHDAYLHAAGEDGNAVCGQTGLCLYAADIHYAEVCPKCLEIVESEHTILQEIK